MIGERLAEVRKDHGDTQQQLGDKLHVTKFTISNWEQEKSVPSNEALAKICRIYNVSADYLLGIVDADPAFYHRSEKLFSKAELEELEKYENYLIWLRCSEQ